MGADTATVLVTGASGSVGHLLVPLLREAGYKVVATDLPGTALPNQEEGLKVMAADLSDSAAAASLLEGVELVVHTAAQVDIGASYEQLKQANVHATAQLYQAASRSKVVRFVYFSAGSIYRLNPNGTYRESSALSANNGYEQTKIVCEEFLYEHQNDRGAPELIVLRPSLIYGPRSRRMSASLACLGPILEASLPVLMGLAGGPRINWVHTKDVARAAVHLLRAGEPGQAYNVADDDAMAFGDLVSFSLETYGLEPRFKLPFPPMGLLRSALPLLGQAGFVFSGMNRVFDRVWEQVCDKYGLERELVPRLDAEALDYANQHFLLLNDKLRETGFEPEYQSIADGWAETIAWYQDQRWVPTYNRS
jgi:nucleoside-diphosphate-sugar epimerase